MDVEVEDLVVVVLDVEALVVVDELADGVSVVVFVRVEVTVKDVELADAVSVAEEVAVVTSTAAKVPPPILSAASPTGMSGSPASE